MANRTWHLTFGFLMYITFAIVWNLHTGWHEENLLWMTVGIMAALWGADLPDYDQQTKYLSHRDIRTHSALIALVFFLITYFLSPVTVLDYIAPSLALFFIGNASHLFLDEWPVWAGSGDPKKGEGMKKGGTLTAARWFVEGVTGDALYKALEGTYLIHLPFRIPVEERKKMQSGKTEMKIEEKKCLSRVQTRLWLFFNAVIDVIFALIILNKVMLWVPWI